MDYAKLDRAFNPRCIAVVGDNRRFMWLKAQSTFRGKLYSVQINTESIKTIEAIGIKNYPSLLDIPDLVDLVIGQRLRRAERHGAADVIENGGGVRPVVADGGMRHGFGLPNWNQESVPTSTSTVAARPPCPLSPWQAAHLLLKTAAPWAGLPLPAGSHEPSGGISISHAAISAGAASCPNPYAP